MAPGNTREPDNEEFLVFGYHCKLFRDDEKALYIDSGRHLIPCMEDESARVDRYDVRLMLSDLKPHEPPPGGYDWFQCLTAEERKMEELCDEERYLALNKDLEEEALYHEEEWKRLRTALGEGAEYNFSYDQKKEETVEPTESAVKEEEAVEVDEPFVPPHNLHIPSDLVAPSTMKQYHVIAKTAKFLANQNPQMEIVLRARQSGNVLFEFLNYGSELNPFYKYLLRVIRSGRFLPEDINPAPEVVKKEEPQPQEEEDDSDDDGGYLHPSLFASSVNLAPPVPVPTAPPTPVVKDNPFAKLISKIQAHTAASLPPPVPPPPRPPLLLAGTAIVNPSLPSMVVPPPPPPPAVPVALPVLIKPPRDLEPIIEKTALYVARNGDAFAATLMSSGDPRLSFLHPSDVHNAYFKQKVLFMRTQGATVVQKPAAPVLKTPAIKPEAGPMIITGTTLSFKLKKRAEEAARLKPSSKFPVEESSSTSDEEEAEKKSTVATSASTSVTSSTPNSDVDDPMDIEEEEKVEENGGGELELSSLSRSDVVLEKGAGKPPDEAKLRDELLTITPKKEEKPVVENEIKQLQMDRKRRAAAFLAKLQKKDSSSGTSNLRPGMKIAAAGAKDVKKTDPEDSSAMKDEPIFEISIPEPPPKKGDIELPKKDVEVPKEEEKEMDFEDVSNVPLPAMNGDSSPVPKDDSEGAEEDVVNGDQETKKEEEKAEDDEEIEEVFSNVEKKQRKRMSDTEDLVSERSASSSRKKKKKRKRSKDETDEEETESGRRRRHHRKRHHSSRRRHLRKRKDSSEERSDVEAESEEEETRRSRHRRHKHRRDDDDDEKKEEEKDEKRRRHHNDRRSKRHRHHHKRRRSEKNDEEEEKSDSDEGSRSDKKRKKVEKDNEEGEVTSDSG